MMFQTHLAFSFLIGLLFIKYFVPYNQVLFMVLCLFGSLLPDIDHPQSKIGRRVKVIGMLFEHRGFFHSGFAVAGLIAAFLFLSKPNIYALGLIIGYASHIVIDMTTKEGIMLLHPVSKFRIRGIIRTGASLEHLLFGALLLADAYMLFTLI